MPKAGGNRGSRNIGGRAARVRSTGIAVDTEGGRIVPATEEAETVLGPNEGQTVVHYYFPVEIEVRAAPDPVDTEQVVKEVLSRLTQNLED